MKRMQKEVQDRLDQVPLHQTVVLKFTTATIPGGTPILPGGLTRTQEDINRATRAYNELKAAMDILGPAATSTQRVQIETARLAAAVEAAGGKYSDMAQKALGVFKETEDLKGLTARIGLLGDLANAEEQVRAKQLAINQANRDGAGINAELRAQIVFAEQTRIAGADLQVRAANLVVSADELMLQKQRELTVAVFGGKMTQEEATQALLNYSRHARDASEATQVYASAFPGLTQAMLDFQNPFKQIDQIGTQSFGNLNNALLDWQTGVKSGSDAIKDFEKQFIRSLLSMMNQMLIMAPIAQMLQNLLNGTGFNFFSLFGGGPNGVGAGTPPAGVAMGGVFDQGRMVHPYALGGIVTHPTLFPMANGAGLMGEAGPEAIMPLKRGSDGRLGVQAGGGGGSVIFAPVYHIDARGSSMTEEQFTAILDKNNKKLAGDIDRGLPDRVAAIQRDPRRRG